MQTSIPSTFEEEIGEKGLLFTFNLLEECLGALPLIEALLAEVSGNPNSKPLATFYISEFRGSNGPSSRIKAAISKPEGELVPNFFEILLSSLFSKLDFLFFSEQIEWSHFGGKLD